jgi:hypothetical protein
VPRVHNQCKPREKRCFIRFFKENPARFLPLAATPTIYDEGRLVRIVLAIENPVLLYRWDIEIESDIANQILERIGFREHFRDKDWREILPGQVAKRFLERKCAVGGDIGFWAGGRSPPR